MIDGMIERVARALLDAPGSTTRDLARAAIEAMREPTETMMMRAGNTPVSNRGDDHKPLRSGRRIGDLAAADAWRTMIAAALEVDDWAWPDGRPKGWDAERAWQPIATAPLDTVVLVHGRNGSIVPAWRHPRTGDWVGCGRRVTHWRPLPLPPAAATDVAEQGVDDAEP